MQRDLAINYMTTRKNHTCYGMGIGIMVLDDAYPGFPGDVRNASAWGFPIQYEIAKGVDNYTLVWEQDKTPCREPIVQAAKNLERTNMAARSLILSGIMKNVLKFQKATMMNLKRT